MRKHVSNHQRERYVAAIVVIFGAMAVALLCWRAAGDTTGNGQHAQAATSSSASTDSATTAANKKRSIIQENLQNYLDKVTADGDASVSFYSLDATSGSSADSTTDQLTYGDGQIVADSNATTTATSASTYKLFIAAYLFHLHQEGKFSWTTANKSGFYQMVVNSSNTFPEEILAEYGADSINAFIKSQGWSSPVFHDGDEAASTTSQSLRKVLQALNAGTGAFSDSSDRSYLLGLMQKQVYRSGIPAGVASVDSGATVADKVGFLDDVNNDAAIVTTSDGHKYILVIMTHGHNQTTLDFIRIKTIAAKVQQIVYGSDAGTKVVSYSAD